MTKFVVEREEEFPDRISVEIEGVEFSLSRDEAHELGDKILDVVQQIWDDVEIPCHEVSKEEYENNVEEVIRKYTAKGENFVVRDENGKVVFSCSCLLKPIIK